MNENEKNKNKRFTKENNEDIDFTDHKLLGQAYNKEYFDSHCGVPYERHLLGQFFEGIADNIIKRINPKKVLDVGCAKGFLVESLRDRGIEAYGMDISEYALSEVRPDIKKFCKAGSITNSIEQKYDLIVCIEVLEHIPPQFADKAVSNLCETTKDIIFSSTPDDTTEPTHHNVQPPEYWTNLFAKHGFFRDTTFDASFISPQAMRLKLSNEPINKIVSSFEKELWFYRKQFVNLRNEVEKLRPLEKASEEKDQLIHKLSENLQEKENYIVKKEKEIKDLIGSIGVQDTKIKDLSGTIESQDTKIKDLSGTIESQDTKIKDLSGTIESQDTKIKDLSGTINSQKEEIESFVEEINSQSNKTDKLKKDVNDLSSALQTQNRNVEILQNELHVIKNSVIFKILRSTAGILDLLLGKNNSKKPNEIKKIVKASREVIKKEGVQSYFSHVGEKIRKNEFTILENTVHLQPTVLESLEIDEDLIKSIKENIATFHYHPKISLIMPVYNTDIKWIEKAIQSVEKQFYENWELCICDDGSTEKKIWPFLSSIAKKNEKIKITKLEQNSGISKASNAPLGLATGEFIGLLDNDDELTQDALYEIILALNKDQSLDMIYSDEDKISETGSISDTFAKPDWSPDLLFSVMYTGHFSVYRHSLIKQIGGFRSEFDFAQDYDLALRVTEKTEKIYHVPKVLYHWRSLMTSAAGPKGKPHARNAAVAAVESSLTRRGYDVKVDATPFSNRPRYVLREHPLVSIIVATDNKENITRCIDNIFEKTLYDNYEIVIVTNTELAKFIKNNYKKEIKIKIVNFDKPYNYSEKANSGAKSSNGDFLLFLNDDIEILHPDWIEALLEILQRKEVGAVSAKLLYENNTIQHAGMVTNVRNLVETSFHQQDKDSRVYFNFVNTIRNVSVMSGACMMVPKKIFDLTSGYDPTNTGIMHSDVDFCFKIRELGKLLVYTPFCEVRHYGHGTISKSPNRKKMEEMSQSNLYLLKRWSHYLSYDPYWTQKMRSLLLYGYQNSTFEIIPGKRNENHFDKKNVLLITHDMTQSGAPMVVYGIAKYLIKKGCFVTVATTQRGPLMEKFEQEGIPVIVDSTLLDDPPNETRNLVTSFDVVIASTILSWRYVFICKDKERPILWIIQESDFGMRMLAKHPEIGQALSLADKVIFSNKVTYKMYLKHHNHNFSIIPGGTPGIAEINNSKKIGQKLTVIHAGGFETRKGQDVLLNAIASLTPENLQCFEFFLIGRVVDQEYYSKIKEMASKFTNINLLDEMSLEKLHEYYAKSDIFVCSSRDESLPLTLLDAMSNKMVIITTNVGGIPEFLKDDKNCLMVNSENYLALSKCLDRILKDKKLFDEIAQGAYDTFQKEFSQEKYGEKIYDLISE